MTLTVTSNVNKSNYSIHILNLRNCSSFYPASDFKQCNKAVCSWPYTAV